MATWRRPALPYPCSFTVEQIEAALGSGKIDGAQMVLATPLRPSPHQAVRSGPCMAVTQSTTRRFCAKLRITPGQCWEWTGCRNAKGYGQFHDGTRLVRAHRWAYERVKGAIPDGALVLHLCDNPSCVRPSHLATGTASANSADMVAKGRSSRGARRWKSKLTDAVVREIRASGMRVCDVVRVYGLTQPHASSILGGRIWRHVK